MRVRWLTLLLNQRAAADAAVRDAVAHLRRRGHRLDVRALWETGDATRYAATAAVAGCDVIVSAGGDGTLNETINGVLSTRRHTAVATLAFGTANDFANAVGLAALDPLAGLTLASEAAPTPIDVGRCNGRYFVNVASGGFGAEVTTQTPRDLKAWLGGLAYTVTGVMKLWTDPERQVRIVRPGHQWSGAVLGFTVANSRLAGGGYVVAPNARLDDGLLDVHLIPPAPILGEVTAYLEELFTGDGKLDEAVGQSWAVPWCEITSPQELQVNLDGEPVRGVAFRFEAVSRRLPMILPVAAAELLRRT